MMNNPMMNKTKEERHAIAKKSHATRKANKEKKIQDKKYLSMYKDSLENEIKLLEDKLSLLQNVGIINDISIKLTKSTLLPPSEIIKNSYKLEDYVGIYFLIQDGEVLYIGQSVNVLGRIATHMNFKEFDSFSYITCKKEELNILESLYVHALRPRLNGKFKNGDFAVPLKISDILDMANINKTKYKR